MRSPEYKPLLRETRETRPVRDGRHFQSGEGLRSFEKLRVTDIFVSVTRSDGNRLFRFEGEKLGFLRLIFACGVAFDLLCLVHYITLR